MMRNISDGTCYELLKNQAEDRIVLYFHSCFRFFSFLSILLINFKTNVITIFVRHVNNNLIPVIAFLVY